MDKVLNLCAFSVLLWVWVTLSSCCVLTKQRPRVSSISFKILTNLNSIQTLPCTSKLNFLLCLFCPEAWILAFHRLFKVDQWESLSMTGIGHSYLIRSNKRYSWCFLLLVTTDTVNISPSYHGNIWAAKHKMLSKCRLPTKSLLRRIIC